MTNEEASQRIQGLRRKVSKPKHRALGWLETWIYKEDVEALNMANKALLEQEPQSFKWCETCKEYDQEKHCCHRYSKVIRDTVEEMKQEYIEREVLNKIRAEIIQSIQNGTLKIESGNEELFRIIDKHKGESEPQESEEV